MNKYLIALTSMTLFSLGCATAPGPSRTPAGQSDGASAVDRLRIFEEEFDSSPQNEARNVREFLVVEDSKAEKSLIFLKAKCKIEVITLVAKDPLTKKPGGLQVRRYTPLKAAANDRGGSVPTVLLLPPTGGENILDLGYADAFCVEGLRTVILERWDGDTNNESDLDAHDTGAIRSLAAVRHTVEYIQRTHRGQIGVFGASLGAINAALAIGHETQFGAAAFIAGGIGMADIIPLSKQQDLTRLRNERKGIYAYADDAAYAKEISSHFSIEPANSIGSTHVTNAWVMIALKDRMVSTKSQNALVDALKEKLTPQHVYVLEHDDDHVETITFAYRTYHDAIARFFKRALTSN